MSSYYGRPILKEPVWTWEIPVYFFTGGLAGASAVLGLGARIAGNERLARASTLISAAADVVSPALLVSDLGRPERFLNMLRVFKVTSPMSVGSWILAASGTTSGATAALELLDVLPRTKVALETLSAIAGPTLATYTGVLIADTAIPVWHEGRHELPWLFGASACATAGAAAAAVVPPSQAGPARRLAVGGVVAEGVLMQAMELRLGSVGEVYRKGAAGKLSLLAKGLAGGGAALLARRGRTSQAAAVAGGLMILGGELALRFAVFRAGFQSARDPKYVVEPQRKRIAEQGTKATTKPH
jgi:formate-dependent nitrite reductase membrane component NrfD